MIQDFEKGFEDPSVEALESQGVFMPREEWEHQKEIQKEISDYYKSNPIERFKDELNRFSQFASELNVDVEDLNKKIDDAFEQGIIYGTSISKIDDDE